MNHLLLQMHYKRKKSDKPLFSPKLWRQQKMTSFHNLYTEWLDSCSFPAGTGESELTEQHFTCRTLVPRCTPLSSQLIIFSSSFPHFGQTFLCIFHLWPVYERESSQGQAFWLFGSTVGAPPWKNSAWYPSACRQNKQALVDFGGFRWGSVLISIPPFCCSWLPGLIFPLQRLSHSSSLPFSRQGYGGALTGISRCATSLHLLLSFTTTHRAVTPCPCTGTHGRAKDIHWTDLEPRSLLYQYFMLSPLFIPISFQSNTTAKSPTVWLAPAWGALKGVLSFAALTSFAKAGQTPEMIECGIPKGGEGTQINTPLCSKWKSCWI